MSCSMYATSPAGDITLNRCLPGILGVLFHSWLWCRGHRLVRGNQMNKKNRHTRKAHRPTYAEDWSDDDVLDHPAVAWKSLQVQLNLHCCHDLSNCPFMCYAMLCALLGNTVQGRKCVVYGNQVLGGPFPPIVCFLGVWMVDDEPKRDTSVVIKQEVLAA